ncbi:hypothetical protein JNUCC64_30600 [Streptomyces sp. JNUCC 64]
MTSVPDPLTARRTWRNELAHAFEVLLGGPLDAFPAEGGYACYHWDDLGQYDALTGLLGGRVDLAAVARGGPVTGDHEAEGDPSGRDRWSYDLGRSVWLFEADALGADGPFGQATGPALRAVSLPAPDSERAVHGADFARVLAERDGGPAGIDEAELTGRTTLLARIGTDGTLFGAMRAATGTLGGPDGLTGFQKGVEVAPEWEEELRRVPDARLRDHLRMLSLAEEDARCDGAYYLGPGRCSGDFDWIAALPGHQAVAGWEFGEGQASSAVFRTG